MISWAKSVSLTAFRDEPLYVTQAENAELIALFVPPEPPDPYLYRTVGEFRGIRVVVDDVKAAEQRRHR